MSEALNSFTNPESSFEVLDATDELFSIISDESPIDWRRVGIDLEFDGSQDSTNYDMYDAFGVVRPTRIESSMYFGASHPDSGRTAEFFCVEGQGVARLFFAQPAFSSLRYLDYAEIIKLTNVVVDGSFHSSLLLSALFGINRKDRLQQNMDNPFPYQFKGDGQYWHGWNSRTFRDVYSQLANDSME